jgi:hypothetical protein
MATLKPEDLGMDVKEMKQTQMAALMVKGALTEMPPEESAAITAAGDSIAALLREQGEHAATAMILGLSKALSGDD